MKKYLQIILMMCLILILTGCKSGKKELSDKMYYLSTDKLSLVGVDYQYKASETEEMIDEAIEVLSTETTEIDYMMTIPSGVSIHEWELSDGNLSLYFTGEYYSLDTYTEVLVRAAVVKTLVQIDDVKSVSFFVDNKPLSDLSGVAVGAMTEDTFIDDFGAETDSLLSTELILYFASADGKSVVAEKREVYYSRNVAVEKLVVEQLLKGPDSSELLASIPADTKINSVSVASGVCYVNFDAAFETAISGVTENATIYSIVNSLTELDSVKQVQFLVNGEQAHLSNTDLDLSSAISRNPDIIIDSTNDPIAEPELDENGDVVDMSEDEIEVDIENPKEDVDWEEPRDQ